MGKRYPPEFWRWAEKEGLPPRGPVGSPQNMIRMVMTPRLYQRWVRLQKEDKRAPV